MKFSFWITSGFRVERALRIANCVSCHFPRGTSVGEGVGVGVGEGVGVGVGVGEGVGVGVGEGVGLATGTPLFQTNFFPDLVHV